jgi:hypothetical protein
MYVFLSSAYLTLQSAAYAFMVGKCFGCVYWWMRLFVYVHFMRKSVILGAKIGWFYEEKKVKPQQQ